MHRIDAKMQQDVHCESALRPEVGMTLHDWAELMTVLGGVVVVGGAAIAAGAWALRHRQRRALVRLQGQAKEILTMAVAQGLSAATASAEVNVALDLKPAELAAGRLAADEGLALHPRVLRATLVESALHVAVDRMDPAARRMVDTRRARNVGGVPPIF
jgi:hypothetical protein